MMKLTETYEYIKDKVDFKTTVGVILGSGLGKIIDKIENPIILRYKDIPNFVNTNVEGHSGNLVFGKIGETNLVFMQGRNHFYEGHSMRDITYPIRVMKSLGVETLITTNAVGGINSYFQVGDIMLVNDHINLMGSNPLIGQVDGEKFIDMSSVYDKELINAGEHAIVSVWDVITRIQSLAIIQWAFTIIGADLCSSFLFKEQKPDPIIFGILTITILTTSNSTLVNPLTDYIGALSKRNILLSVIAIVQVPIIWIGGFYFGIIGSIISYVLILIIINIGYLHICNQLLHCH